MTSKTHTGAQQVGDKLQDAAGAMAGRVAAKTAGSHDDQTFVNNAACGDMFEIAAGKVVLAHSRNDKVRMTAVKMIRDHTALSHQLNSAISMSEVPKEIGLPTAIDSRRKKVLDNLTSSPPEALDKTYVDQQILAHKETIDLMAGYTNHGSNAQLRSVAASALPVVQRHLRHLEDLRGDLS
jgi:putative membrane protein